MTKHDYLNVNLLSFIAITSEVFFICLIAKTWTKETQQALFRSTSGQATTGCPSKIVPRLRGCYGGAIDSIISVFIQLHRSGFNLEFETLFESI